MIYMDFLHITQKDNNGIVMVNFYAAFVNCTNPDAATMEQVAGIYVAIHVHAEIMCMNIIMAMQE